MTQGAFVFDEPTARDGAIALGLEAAKAAWKLAAYEAVETLAASGRYFTADDVTELMGDALETHDLRALGGVLNGARAAGLIRNTLLAFTAVRMPCHKARCVGGFTTIPGQPAAREGKQISDHDRPKYGISGLCI